MRSAVHGLPKHLLHDDEEDRVFEYLALGLTWLVVSTAFSVLVGKCIAAGLSGGTCRDRHLPRSEEETPPVLGEALGDGLAVPAQRRPSAPAERVG